MNIVDLKNKILKKLKNNTFFIKHFGFESGIDITNDKQLLYRKNVVIKNIIFVSNLFYTLLFTIISFGDNSNWLLTVLFFPITYFVNSTLAKLIKKGPDDELSQIIAQYASCFYMFLSSLVIYIKLKNGTQVYLQESGYILLYYSLAICSYYQDKNMFKNICKILFILVTFLHFTVTYNVVNEYQGHDFIYFLQNFFTSNEFKDIILRTILLFLFMVVLYIYVSMTNYMQNERKKELIKRRDVQEDFTNVVTKIFDVTLQQGSKTQEDIKNIRLIADMSKKLASLMSLDPDECEKIYKFSTIHIDQEVSFHPEGTEDEKFEKLREQTELGSSLISRIQLERKSEDIIRATLEESDDDEFRQAMNKIQNDSNSQIILICELYVILRSSKSFKRSYNHSKSIMYMKDHCHYYFDPILFDRFMKFETDFDSIYTGE